MNQIFTIATMVAFAGMLALSGCSNTEELTSETGQASATDVPVEIISSELDSAMGNATYIIEEKEITLTDGMFSQPAAPGSASMETAYLSDDTVTMGDLNGDGIENDYTGILTYSGGGSGTFSYVVALIDGEGTNGVMIGDRVQVDDVTIDAAGIITVHMYDRGEGESMADEPNVAITKKIVVIDGVLEEQK